MLRYFLITVLISNFFGSAYAFGYLEPEHIGALCIDCHKKFSFRQAGFENFSAPVKNTDVTDIFPCYKKPCHYSSNTKWGGGGDRYGLHLRDRICQNCHGLNREYKIHVVHRRDNASVDCNICHKSPEGWSSPTVAVPPYDEVYVAGSAIKNMSIIIQPWNDDCGYCHKSAANASRQHEVHAPAIERVCVECHGEIIETVPNPLKKAIIEGVVGKPEPQVSIASSLLVEFTGLFDRISLQILNFYNFMRE